MAETTMNIESLTDCESVVMKCLWDAEQDISLMDIMDTLATKYHKEWKRQTVSTFLLHLINKNFVTSYRVGRVFYYRIEIPLDTYMKKVTTEFMDFWYDGDVAKLNSKVNMWSEQDAE